MALMTIDVVGRVKDGDIIVFKGGVWTSMSKPEYLADIEAEIDGYNKDLQEKVKNLQKELVETRQALNDCGKDLANFKGLVNSRLKEYHNILNVLTK